MPGFAHMAERLPAAEHRVAEVRSQALEKGAPALGPALTLSDTGVDEGQTDQSCADVTFG